MGAVAAPVNPPQKRGRAVPAGVNQAITLPQTLVSLKGGATDDGLPVGSHLTIMWSELSGPASVTFSNPVYPQTFAYFTMRGVYVLQLSANDTQYTSTSTVTITVNPPINQPPVVSAGNFQTITQPTNTVT